MIAADFFSGLGGFSEGASQAGAEVRFAANHWPAAVEAHRANHPEARHEAQDLQQLDMAMLPDLTDGLLLAAPACQGHSTNSQPARRGRGGSHAPQVAEAQQRSILQRSTAFAVIAAAEIARPRGIIVENVPQFLGWVLFPAWSGALEALGYSVRAHVLNASNYGSAQDRRRMILTASLGRPIELAESLQVSALSLGDVVDLDDRPEHRWSEISSKSERMQAGMKKAQAGAGSLCVWNNVSQARGRSMSDLAPTLTTRSGSQLYLLDGTRGRLLTPREQARIQGFPDSYVLPASRDLAGRMIGNAIDVSLARGVVAQAMEVMAA